MKARIIDVEICKEHFNYDEDGNLYWKKLFSENCRNGKAVIGGIAGCFHRTTGYYIVRLGGKRYQMHRILYQMYNNVTLDPDQRIDHIDMDKRNNKKNNLRICSDSENNMNRSVQKNNLSTGIKNITLTSDKHRTRYYVLCVCKDKNYTTIRFRTDRYTLEHVISIRDELLKELHGKFHNLG